MKTTLIRKSANATMRFKMTFKVTLHVLLGIAVLFIAIIPARMVSGIFSQDTTIFIISLSGFIALLEYVVWCFLKGPSVVYDSLKFSKADGLLRDSPTVDVPIKPILANTEMDSQGSIEKVVEEAPPICTTSWLLSSSRRKWTAFVAKSCLSPSIQTICRSRGRVSKEL